MSMKEFASDTGAVLLDEPATEKPASHEQFAMLDLSRITPSLTNPRKAFNEAKMLDLAESIKVSGVHQPILVRPLPGNRLDDTFRNRGDGMPLPTHEIVSGERRYRASKAAQQTTIPAMIRQLSDQEVLEIQIVENLQRDDLTELEEAEGYQRLCDETNLAKELVGERIGKSRSYVYGRMKLLDLSSGPREALRAGEIDGSKALLIARIPDEKLQIKALEAAMEKDHQGSPRLSYRALQTWVQQNVMLKLSAARFTITDASLVPAAGDCPSCSKRTGANPDLFADVDGPDVCTDPPCFHAKAAAHSEQLIARAKAKGMEVIEGKEALELQPHRWDTYLHGYTDLDDEIRTALPERELKGKVKLFVNPHNGEVREIVPDALAEKAERKANGGKVSEQMAKQLAKDKERQAERDALQLAEDYQDRWRKAATDAIKPRILAGEIQSLSANLLRRVLLEISIVDQRCNEGTLGDVLELEGYHCDDELVQSSVRSLDDNQVGYTVLLLLLEGDRNCRNDWEDGKCMVDDSAPVIEELSSLLGLDLAAIKADVQAQIRAERAPQAPAGEDLAAQPEGSAKGEKSKSKPAAPARKGKTTKEEAAASIAAALQELDAGPVEGQEASEAPQVSDRVMVIDVDSLYHEEEGTVTAVLSNGKVRVTFADGNDPTMPAASVKVVAAALWPFPRNPSERTEPAVELKEGMRVKVRSTLMAGLHTEYFGKEGKLKSAVAGGTKWIVNLAKPKKAPKLVELEADVLEVLA
ncbi:ParB/RepB/Spo0J family partition protein [Variovorax sp. W2I14]|uniref:ParB/RepB/Spo0J family partition protein n=1 Tax=Variovorax sp. W2I14 TaxID=3042290 RepID=UPI003D1BE375